MRAERIPASWAVTSCWCVWRVIENHEPHCRRETLLQAGHVGRLQQMFNDVAALWPPGSRCSPLAPRPREATAVIRGRRGVVVLECPGQWGNKLGAYILARIVAEELGWGLEVCIVAIFCCRCCHILISSPHITMHPFHASYEAHMTFSLFLPSPALPPKLMHAEATVRLVSWGLGSRMYTFHYTICDVHYPMP